MYCSVCGKEIPNESVFCLGCGSKVGNSFNQPPYNQPPYNQPPYNQPPYNQSPYNQPIYNQNKTPVSIILGIVGIVFAWIFALIGHITSITGIVIGVKEYKETGKVAGLVLSIIGEICSILSSAIGVIFSLIMYM